MTSTLRCSVRRFNAADMKAILGFRTELKEGEVGIRFQDGDGVFKKFVLDNNMDNRPFELRLAEEYQETFLNGEWAGQWNSPSETGGPDSFSVAENRQVVSMAHRGVGLILAQAKIDLMRQFGMSEELEELGVPEAPLDIEGVFVEGVDPNAADFADMGKGRTLGDVLFRRHAANSGKVLSLADKKLLNRELGVALRLVWLRTNGSLVAGGRKLSFAEALKFLKTHPLLTDCLLHVHAESGTEKKIANYVSLGYAAGLMYLAGFSNVLREKIEAGEIEMEHKPKGYGNAEKFWTLLAAFTVTGTDTSKAPSIAGVVDLLRKNKEKQRKYTRDELVVLLTRAWLSFDEAEEAKDKWNTAKALEVGLTKKVDKKEVLQVCYFGGLDVSREVLIENGWIRIDSDKPARKRIAGYKVGDTVWVDQPKMEPWFGVLHEITSETTVNVSDPEAKDGKGAKTEAIYGCDLAWLKNEKPVRLPEPVKTVEAPKPVKAAPARKPPTAPVAAAS